MSSRPPRVNRRAFLRGALAAGLAGSASPSLRARRAPSIVRSPRAMPAVPFGVSAGDVQNGRAIVWSRTDRPARLFVDIATTDKFSDVRTFRGPAALDVSDFSARVPIDGLPAGQRIFYRVRFQDLSDMRTWSEPVVGSFTTAAAGGDRDLSIAYSADTVGQGWGINPDFGGLKLYETMRRAEPDVFINLGDTIYADQPLQAEVKLDDGTIWKNVVTEAKSRIAQSLPDFRGCFQYNLMDEHMRRFNAGVSQVVIWDDHEVRDNWYYERDLSRDDRYTTVKSVPLLAAHARQAFFEYNPIPLQADDPERVYRTVSCGPLAEIFALDLRSYRGANNPNRQTTLGDESRIMGRAQVEWLKTRLAASRASWKVIANDMPIGLAVPDGPGRWEAVANDDPGAPLGRELEFAEIFTFIKDRRIRNVVWITADVHYCSAIRYDPARATFTDFDPFWEFVAGPLHAGTFGPNALDATFGPEVKFTGIPPGMAPNRPPSAGFQFFGTLRINARTKALTAGLHDLAGRTLFSTELEALR